MSMLTAEDLRAIAARHAEVEADHAGTSNDYPLPYDRSQEHVDRGALLALVRRLTDIGSPFQGGRDGDECLWCDGCMSHNEGCHFDAAAQGVKP